MKKLNPKTHIGDGKLPNHYWVFQYDSKYKRVKEKDGSINLELIQEDKETKDSLIGEFNTWQEALECVDNKAYLPNVIIEDRLSGQVFEQYCIVCQECNKEEWQSNTDIAYSKKRIEEARQVFK
jgi:hypothetical protein